MFLWLRKEIKGGGNWFLLPFNVLLSLPKITKQKKKHNKLRSSTYPQRPWFKKFLPHCPTRSIFITAPKLFARILLDTNTCASLIKQARKLVSAGDLSGDHGFYVIGGARACGQVPHRLPRSSHQHRVLKTHPAAAAQLLEPRRHAEACGGRVGQELVEQNADEVAPRFHREGHAFLQRPLHAKRLEARAGVTLRGRQIVAAHVMSVDADEVA